MEAGTALGLPPTLSAEDTCVPSAMVGVGACSLSQQSLWVLGGGGLHRPPGSWPAWGGVCAPLPMAPSAPRAASQADSPCPPFSQPSSGAWAGESRWGCAVEVKVSSPGLLLDSCHLCQLLGDMCTLSSHQEPLLSCSSPWQLPGWSFCFKVEFDELHLPDG